MSAWGTLDNYLRRLERRLRWVTWTRGLAIAGACALLATVVLVYFANAFAFSDRAVGAARGLYRPPLR